MVKLVFTTVLMLASSGAAFASVQNSGVSGRVGTVRVATPMVYEKPAASYRGQHFTNSLGCTYSRTQAPGYPMVWHLQVNSRVPGCPNTIPGF